MIRFLYGSNAAQRDAALLRHINENTKNGEKAILLVPEQETVTAERRMVEALPPTAQLTFEVSNFTRLANRTFRAVGGLSYRYATPAASALIMWKSLRAIAPQLTQYGAHAANDLRLTERMLSAIAQFKAYCITPEALTETAGALPEDDPLKSKLGDLALVLATYQSELYARFADAADDVSRATALIAAHKHLFADTHFYISSFTDFTAQELALIKVLIKSSPTLTVALPLADRHHEGIHLASALATKQRLWRIAKELDERIFEEVLPTEKPKTALDHLRRDLFDMNAEPAPVGLAGGGEIALTVAATPYEEAEHAAAVIAKAVREGARYRDFVIVVRDATNYIGIIDAALEKEGVPFYLSEKTDITVRPLIKLLLFALRIARYNWQKEDVVGYLKTGLTGIDADDINFFEEYAEVWHICGKTALEKPFTMNPDGYTERTSARAARILDGANRARAALTPPLTAYFEALDRALTAADFAAATYRFLATLGVPDTMKARAAAHLVAGERREAEEDTRLWGVVIDALEILADTLEKEQLDIASFADALLLLFNSTDIGSIPTSADEVMIGSAATLRAAPSRYAIVMGLNDGVFPKTAADTGLLSDAEKRRLAALGMELSADLATVASDELFYVHRALTLPREKLYLSYAKAACDGRAAEPSIAITRIKALFPELNATDFETIPASDKIFTREAALEHMRELSPIEAQALFSLLKEDAEQAKKIENLLLPVQDTAASVSPERAQGLFTPHSFNPTGLEKFVSCKFAYYCSKILHLREEPTDSLDAAAVGTFIHYVLENTLAAITKGEKPFTAYTDKEIDAIVHKSLTAYRAHLIEAGGGITPRAEALVSRLSSLARIVVGALVAEFADSDFAPAFFELDLSREGTSIPLTLPDGTKIPLSGKADRVDWYRGEDDRVFLRVADYKTGRKTFKREDIKKGYCLQMPLYLFALCNGTHPQLAKKLGLPEGTQFQPAGVTYLSTAVGNENTPARVEKSEALESAAARLKREGLLPDSPELLHAISRSGSTAILGSPQARKSKLVSSEGFVELFDELANTVSDIAKDMKSGSATISPTEHNGQTACKFCAYAAVCRAADKKK
ncbi:MAG: exodeoxyribonuclease V subunit gamma [Clostridia bacterium]|nr:exodeoxyribonuclease V subunit gamma [Clostridia bacterium]